MCRGIEFAAGFGSLFAGGGGSTTGYVMAGYQALLELDLASSAIRTLKENYSSSLPMRVNINAIDGKWILETLGMEPGELHLLDASPSCKGFSFLSDRKFFNVQNKMSLKVLEIVSVVRPVSVVMENVEGMSKGHMRPYFDKVVLGLESLGYRVAYTTMNAAYHGVPQTRVRLIVMAIRNDIGVTPTFPAPNDTFTSVRDVLPELLAIESIHRSSRKRRSTRYPANTLTTQDSINVMDKDGVRKPTVPELLKLSSFPDGYILPVPFDEAMTIIGNCVPPLLMKSIADHLWEICLKDQCTLVFPDGKWFIGHEGKRVISRTALDALDKPEFDPGLRDTEEEVPEAKIKSPEEIEQEKIKWAMYFKEVRERAKEYNKRLDKIG